MFLSKLFLPLQKEAPSDAVSTSHKLMLKAGLIKQTASGLYTWLPLGLKILKKINAVIKQELDVAGCNEILLPILQPSSFWQASGRYNTYGKEMLRVTDRHEAELVYGPTAEEAMVEIAKGEIKSYKQLPLSLYNIQFKFRDELRPRFGVMRSREFIMLDSYSFDIDEKSAVESYFDHYEAFLKIFFRLGLAVMPNAAATGEIGGSLSHEFNFIAPSGESSVFVEQGYLEVVEKFQQNISNEGHKYADTLLKFYAKTDEKIIDEFAKSTEPLNSWQAAVLNGSVKLDAQSLSNFTGKNIVEQKTIELGHTFFFADKYSKPMNMLVSDASGKQINPQMGSYGIGPARVLAAFIETNFDENGIKFTPQLAPFDVIIVNLIKGDLAKATKIYSQLKQANLDVLLDDTEDSAGQKFAKADLIGVPVQIVISQKHGENEVELNFRSLKSKQDTQNFYTKFLLSQNFTASQIVKTENLASLILSLQP